MQCQVVAPAIGLLKQEARAALLAALPRFLVLVFVNRNRVQILCFKNLPAIKAADVFHAVPAVEELGSLVLTTLHSEITLF
jgi:hypothetical protein